MYYKIVNKESEVYQKLHAMRSEELQFEKDNVKAIEEKTGHKWTTFFGREGQQTFGRVNEYAGFVFTEPEKVDPIIWKKHPEHNKTFIPNPKTKAGREMKKFLNNELKGNWFGKVYDKLGVSRPMGRFTFPYVEICGETIVMYFDDKIEFTDENIIEITKTEFIKIQQELIKK